MPPKIGHHMDHYAGQLCKDILMLSEPAHQETEKWKIFNFLSSFSGWKKQVHIRNGTTSFSSFPYAAASENAKQFRIVSYCVDF
jgi:hypothetical protein